MNFAQAFSKSLRNSSFTFLGKSLVFLGLSNLSGCDWINKNNKQTTLQEEKLSASLGAPSPWSFGYVYPVPKNESELTQRDYISATEIFSRYKNGNETLQAILAHSAGQVEIPGFDRAVFDFDLAEPNAGRECFEQMSNWFVSQVRFDPNGFDLPDSPEAVENAFKSFGSFPSLEKTLEFRLTIQPVCFLSKEIVADHAIHLIFKARNSTEIQNEIESSVGVYQSVIKIDNPSANAEDAFAAIQKLGSILNGSGYSVFRNNLMEKWFQLGRLDPSRDKNLKTLGDLYEQMMESKNGGLSDDRFAYGSLLNKNSFSAELKKLTLELTAKKEDLHHTASMFTQSLTAEVWFFSGTKPISMKLTQPVLFEQLDDVAKNVYQFVTPVKLSTGVTGFTNGKVTHFPLTTVESNGGVAQLHSTGFGRRRKILRMDFLPNFDIDAQAFPRDLNGGNLIPISNTLMGRFVNPSKVNASTTACETCHRLARATSTASGMQLNNSVEFHLLGWDKNAQAISNVRSMFEMKQNFVKIAVEQNQKNLETKFNLKSLNSCVNENTKIEAISRCLDVDKKDVLTCFSVCEKN